MLKRAFDLAVSLGGLIVAGPFIGVGAFLVWLQDYKSPFYIASRVGRGEHLFRMVKLRSMVMNADKSGVDSTSAADPRITSIGRFIRSYKLDELPQLWNVFKGEMSFVGPRPNVKRETDLYSPVEKRLLEVRPGITDFASIVFADEGDILKGHADPDLAYNQLIRPWKSRLGIFYVEHQGVLVDLQVILLTALAIVSRKAALVRLERLLASLGADAELRKVALREVALTPTPPPGLASIVMSRSTS